MPQGVQGPYMEARFEEYRDLGLLEVSIDECLDEILADDARD